MAKFKVGDRVKCVDAHLSSGGLVSGKTYSVAASPSERFGARFGARCVDLSEAGAGWYEYRFELVEPLKLEVGATVTIGDGHDEWAVTAITNSSAWLTRDGAVVHLRDNADLTVTRAKPEPPITVGDLVTIDGGMDAWIVSSPASGDELGLRFGRAVAWVRADILKRV